MDLTLVFGLGPATFAVAYYVAQARIFKAPRERATAAMRSRAQKLAAAVPEVGPGRNPVMWARTVGAVGLALLVEGMRCRKCWAQSAAWGQLWVLRGSPWGWTRAEFVASIAAAGLAILAYEIVESRKR